MDRLKEARALRDKLREDRDHYREKQNDAQKAYEKWDRTVKQLEMQICDFLDENLDRCNEDAIWKIVDTESGQDNSLRRTFETARKSCDEHLYMMVDDAGSYVEALNA